MNIVKKLDENSFGCILGFLILFVILFTGFSSHTQAQELPTLDCHPNIERVVKSPDDYGNIAILEDREAISYVMEELFKIPNLVKPLTSLSSLRYLGFDTSSNKLYFINNDYCINTKVVVFISSPTFREILVGLGKGNDEPEEEREAHSE